MRYPKITISTSVLSSSNLRASGLTHSPLMQAYAAVMLSSTCQPEEVGLSMPSRHGRLLEMPVISHPTCPGLGRSRLQLSLSAPSPSGRTRVPHLCPRKSTQLHVFATNTAIIAPSPRQPGACLVVTAEERPSTANVHKLGGITVKGIRPFANEATSCTEPRKGLPHSVYTTLHHRDLVRPAASGPSI